MADQKNSFFRLPSTKLGRWTVVLEAVFVVMYVIHIPLMASDITWTPWQIFRYSMWIFGLGACILGLIALFFTYERSWLVNPIIISVALLFLFVLDWYIWLGLVHG